MYLSRVEIDLNDRRKIKDLSHVGAYHNWVEQSFPEEFNKSERTRKLWRVDYIQGKSYLVILSKEKPDKELLEKYGVEGSGITRFYGSYLDELKEGQRLMFKISLNPVISIANEGKNRGKVKQIAGEKNQIDFLLKRSTKYGFELSGEEFYISGSRYEVLKKQNLHSERFLKLDYQGILTVKDIEVFKNTLINGFGKKKAYGCGLMTVIPVE